MKPQLTTYLNLKMENTLMLPNTEKYLRPSQYRPLVIATLLIGLISSADASVSYQQDPVNEGNVIFANTSAGAVIADNFSVASAFNLESLSWWGGYDTSDSDNFIITLHSDASGIPGTQLKEYSSINVTATAASLIDISGAPVYRYDYTLPTALSLASGSYYLSITNETTASNWYWLTGTGGDAQHWNLDSDGSTWVVDSSGDLATAVQYSVTAVPIPPAFLLMMAGLACLGRVVKNPARRG
ncbi:MAG: hypothetical protein WCS87_13710 [Methylococcaceae bacterium]